MMATATPIELASLALDHKEDYEERELGGLRKRFAGAVNSTLLTASPTVARREGDPSKTTEDHDVVALRAIGAKHFWTSFQVSATKLIDQLLGCEYTPERARSISYMRARLAVSFSVLVFSFIPPWLVLWFAWGLLFPALVVTGCGVNLVGAVLLLRFKNASSAAVTIAGNLICFSVMTTLTVNSCMTGGYSSSLRLWMAILPLLSALLLGRAWTLVWSLLVSCNLAAFYILGLINNGPLPSILPAEIKVHMDFALEFSLIIGIMLLSLVYQSQLDGAVNETRVANQELTIAKEAAETEIRVRQEFLAMVSHEIRTPMNGMMATISALMENTSNMTFAQRELLQISSNSGTLLMTLINDMIDLTSLQSGRLSLGDDPYSIIEVTARVVSSLNAAASSKKLSIVTEHSIRDLPAFMSGDSTRIYQVFYKLVSNAIKFTESGSISIRLSGSQFADYIPSPMDSERTFTLPPLSISPSPEADYYRESPRYSPNQPRPAQQASAPCLISSGSPVTYSPYVLIEVEDTGVGIPIAEQARIFDPFVQLERNLGGTGMGLSLSKRLVELMGGHIGVHSVEGKGSKFWFTLPVKAWKESFYVKMEGERLVDLSQEEKNETKILIVEDNRTNQKVLTRLLQKFGFEPDVANHGLEAVCSIQEKNYSVIFMDVQMPVMNGYEATKAIRNLESAASLSTKSFIVGLTASGSPLDCYSAGMNHFIQKPFRTEQIYDAIQGALRFNNNVNNNKSNASTPRDGQLSSSRS